MRNMILLSVLTLVSATGFAREPKATACAPQASRAATSLFLLNNPEVTNFSVELELNDMNHAEEGGYEVWDVKFTGSEGETYSPYRMTLNIDACTVTNFEMPGPG